MNLVDALFPARHPTKTWHRAGAEDTKSALWENECLHAAGKGEMISCKEGVRGRINSGSEIKTGKSEFAELQATNGAKYSLLTSEHQGAAARRRGHHR